MPSPTKILKDVRALGMSAPLRAVYELSKRTNGHSLLFREVEGGYRSVPVPFGHHIPSDDAPRARCLDDARAIVNKGTRVFGRRVATGVSASWAMDPLTERCWPEDTPWWQIDIRTDARLSDVKLVWEAARHRDLVVLARAAVLEPEELWFAALEEMLVRWCRECRPEQGVNWYSSLELALRAIAWNQVLVLVGDRLHLGLRAEIDDQLVASARHIMVELPYTMTSMKNNHLLGDGLGLVVLGRMFPDHPAANRWQRIGDRLMLKQLARHMQPDGSMIEDSLSYHRFVLEMFIVRALLGDAPGEVTAATRSAAEHLIALGVAEGDVPQFGDWDEGRVLADSNPAGDVAGAAYLALQLTGSVVPGTAWQRYDELAWYIGAPSTDVDPGSPRSGTWGSGHFSGAVHGDWHVWLKRDLTHSHQHADLTSVWIRAGGRWVVRDPGTGTYNGPLAVRDGFRASAAHPVWTPSGRDLLGPHRAFRWERATVPCGHGHAGSKDRSVLVSWHDGFEGRSLRVVVVDSDGVVVLDRLPAVTAEWAMTVPEGPGGEALWGLDAAAVVEGEKSPFAGWHSDTYDSWQTSRWRRPTEDAGWTAWGAGRPRAIVASTDDRVVLDGLSVDISLDAETVSVVVVVEGEATLAVQAHRA